MDHKAMDRERILHVLREHESELKAGGIHHLRLFGSYARDEASERSDVDLVADLDLQITPTLLKFAGHQIAITEILGRPVDLCAAGAMRPSVQANVDREAVLVF